MKILNKGISLLFQASRQDALIVLEFLLIASYINFIVRHIPLRFYYKHYFSTARKKELLMQPSEHDISIFNKLKPYLPFKLTCLMNSMIIHQFYKAKNIHVPIIIGVSTGKEFRAHAWCRPESLCSSFKEIQI